jgi:nucleoside-triphosphatase
MARAQLITGPPGVGKTTLLLAILEMLPGRKGGFTTREIREGGERVGFEITDLSGRAGILAHVRRPGPPRVGRYGVDLTTLETIGVRAVTHALHEADLIVIDEIGKMELCSTPFQAVLFEALDGPRPLLGTIMAKPHPVADQIKARPEVQVQRLTPTNSQEVIRTITADLGGRLASAGISC